MITVPDDIFDGASPSDLWTRLAGFIGIGDRKSTPVIEVSTARVQALNTTAVNIVNAVPNALLLPTGMIVRKLAGAYTVAGITAGGGMTMGWGTVADNKPCMPWDAGPGFSLLEHSDDCTYYIDGLIHNGFTAGLPFSVVPDVFSLINKPLAIRTLGASPAGSGGKLYLKCFYRVISADELRIGP